MGEAPASGELSATRDGRWGVHQFFNGKPTGGGTVNCGWPTEQAARDANPPYESPLGVHTYQPFERWPERCRSAEAPTVKLTDSSSVISRSAPREATASRPEPPVSPSRRT